MFELTLQHDPTQLGSQDVSIAVFIMPWYGIIPLPCQPAIPTHLMFPGVAFERFELFSLALKWANNKWNAFTSRSAASRFRGMVALFHFIHLRGSYMFPHGTSPPTCRVPKTSDGSRQVVVWRLPRRLRPWLCKACMHGFRRERELSMEGHFRVSMDQHNIAQTRMLQADRCWCSERILQYVVTHIDNRTKSTC